MQKLEFPIIGAKTPGVKQKFDLSDPRERKKYFQAKAGQEITLIKKYLKKGTFMAFLVGKKNSGKGTYLSYLREIFGADAFASVGVGT